jgi:hypothetical protein
VLCELPELFEPYKDYIINYADASEVGRLFVRVIDSALFAHVLLCVRVVVFVCDAEFAGVNVAYGGGSVCAYRYGACQRDARARVCVCVIVRSLLPLCCVTCALPL